MNDKYAKELIKEMKLIRKELEYMNGVGIMEDGRKMNRKTYNAMMTGDLMKRGVDNE